MKKVQLLILLFVMSISQLAIGQTSKRHFLYSYDASGNRIKRMYVLVPCPGCRDAQIATTLEDSLLQLATNQPVEKSNPLEIKANNGDKIGFSLYPNPTSNSFFIQWNVDIASANLRIFDTKGSVVYEDNLFGRYWQIDISLLSKGLYFVKIEMEGTQFDAKMEKL
jgi:hypothetical protein